MTLTVTGDLPTFYENARGETVQLDEGLYRLLSTRRLFKEVRWQDYAKDETDRTPTTDLGEAEAASSLRAGGAAKRHAIMFDIDVPAWLTSDGLFIAKGAKGNFVWWVPRDPDSLMRYPAWLLPSSTSGHSHLYVDADLPQVEMFEILDRFTDAGVVEEGYRAVCKQRGFTSLRLPWVHKTPPPAADAPLREAF